MTPGDDSKIVVLRGLPTKASKEDVLAFLEGCGPLQQEQIHLVKPGGGRSHAEAFVAFSNMEEAQRACENDKNFFSPKFGERYVRVAIAEDMVPGNLPTLGAAVAAKASRSRRTNQKVESVVKVTGLPHGITPPEVLQLFWGWQAKVTGTYIRSVDHEKRLEAFVEFEVREHATQAVSQRHGTTITMAAGQFSLGMQKATKGEWDAVVAAEQGRDGIVRLKGLPTKATTGDVMAFLDGYRIKLGGVHVQPFSENRHSKIALVVFETAEEATRALEKDRQPFGEAFGDRYCLVQLVCRAEFEQDMRKFQCQLSGNGTSSSSGGTLGTASATLGTGQLSTAAVTSSFASMPTFPACPPGMGMLPQAAAAATGFMPPVLPPIPGGMMLPPGYVVPPTMAPMPGSWPAAAAIPAAAHMQHLLPPHATPGVGLPPEVPGVLPAAAAALGPPPGSHAPPWPGVPPAMLGNTAAARYMVQDLTTGQKVFLDPRFNLSSYGAMPAAGLASCSAVATAGTTFGTAATGPAASQQRELQAEMSENSNKSSGQGHSVAVAGTGASVPAANGSSGQSGQTGAAYASVTHARRRHTHHHHHSRHHHHHNHVRNGGGSSGDDEGARTKGGSSGGSNEGSDNGSGADELAPNGHIRRAEDAPDADGSSGEGSGANDGAAANDHVLRHVAPATAEETDGAAMHMEEEAPERAGGASQYLQPRADSQKESSRLHSPLVPAALLADGVAVPPVKRTRSQ